MNLGKYITTLESPSVQAFLNLRNKVGWGEADVEMAKMSLKNSLFHVVIRDKSQVIGMARVVGDGFMYFYVQDVIVDPDYQKQGIGNGLMFEIEKYLSVVAKKGATVALLAAKGKEEFYARFGYTERPNDSLGNGMCKFI
ncbi:GNAT family N-acetyltransferase [Shewanella sp. VB17]|uniref:GNAT family N-acetyltransferase n=1 Tax=Shewanella sp. VB17 TaxID=2739432 RepID=UPI0015678830|nr:GNAT family N-acetyltransferase [Shewanella sp. VB17]NRD74336.1 GNAT family N-acetyltransferase [Shewanella sp. VB17]